MELVLFVNNHCDMERQIDGSLTSLGSLKAKILEEKYLGDDGECERIEVPTREEFFRNYVMKSKPVVIKSGSFASS